MGRQTERGGRLSERRDGTWFFKYGCHISRRTKRKEGRTNERDAERIGDRDRAGAEREVSLGSKAGYYPSTFVALRRSRTKMKREER